MAGPRVDTLVAKLEKGGQRTREILGGLSPQEWDLVVYNDPDPWTIRDVLAHFVSSEEYLRAMAQDVVDGGKGAPEMLDLNAVNAAEQERLEERPSAELLADLVAERERTLAWVRTLDDSALDLEGRHPALGYANVEGFINAIYGHHILHMREVQPVLAAAREG
ncbi:MAG: DinB family protein [Anaerolineae bacterium]